jgi:hypothetical protein
MAAIVLACTNPPSLFNFYLTEESAKADLPRANRDEPGKYSLMSEFHSGPYTHQYVAVSRDGNTRYFSKLVDATDESTWMMAEAWK